MTLELTQTRIDELQNYVTNEDPAGYYTALASWGSEYAELALGVVQNNIVSDPITD
jgi:hypothetical protein